MRDGLEIPADSSQETLLKQLDILNNYENALHGKIQESSEDKQDSGLKKELKDTQTRIAKIKGILKEQDEKITSSVSNNFSFELKEENGLNKKSMDKSSTPNNDDEDDEDELLHELFCPIRKEIMKDPVMTVDGHSYEREAIEEWFQSHKTSPLTGKELPDLRLTPNYALKKLIETFQKPTNFKEKIEKFKMRQKILDESEKNLRNKELELKKMEMVGLLPSLEKQEELYKKIEVIDNKLGDIVTKQKQVYSRHHNNRKTSAKYGATITGMLYLGWASLNKKMSNELGALPELLESADTTQTVCEVSKFNWGMAGMMLGAGGLMGLGLAEAYNRRYDSVTPLNEKAEALEREKQVMKKELRQVQLQKAEINKFSMSVALVSDDEKVCSKDISETVIMLRKNTNIDNEVSCWFKKEGDVIRQELVLTSEYVRKLPFPKSGQCSYRITQVNDRELIDKILLLILSDKQYNNQRFLKTNVGGSPFPDVMVPGNQSNFAVG